MKALAVLLVLVLAPACPSIQARSLKDAEIENERMRTKVVEGSALFDKYVSEKSVFEGVPFIGGESDEQVVRRKKLMELYDDFRKELDVQRDVTLPGIQKELDEAEKRLSDARGLGRDLGEARFASAVPVAGQSTRLRWPGEDRERYSTALDRADSLLQQIETAMPVAAAAYARADVLLEESRESAFATLDALTAGSPSVSSSAALTMIASTAAALDALGDPFEEVFLLDMGGTARRLEEQARIALDALPRDVIVATERLRRTTFDVGVSVALPSVAVGDLRVGDVVTIDLPRGFRLSEPIEVVPASGLELEIDGNEAGSEAISLLVTATDGDSTIRLRTEQTLRGRRITERVGDLQVVSTATRGPCCRQARLVVVGD